MTTKSSVLLHCRELDGERTGILSIDDDRVELYLVSYTEFTDISHKDQFFVVTENGEVASLLANIPGKFNQTNRTLRFAGKDLSVGKNERRTVWKNGVVSNQAVLGVDAWHPEEKIHFAAFDLQGLEQTLKNSDKLQAIGQLSAPAKQDLELFTAKTDNARLRASYRAFFNFDTRTYTNFEARFSVEFNNGVRLDQLDRDLFGFASFFAFLIGDFTFPSDIGIDRLSREEIERGVAKGTYIRGHDIIGRFRPNKRIAENAGSLITPFNASNSGEIEALRLALERWATRSPAWGKAYIGMTASLTLQGETSGERLMAAWRWFEKIPTAMARKTVEDDEIKPVIDAAIQAAKTSQASELSITQDRIKSSLARLTNETRKQQFCRLLHSLKDTFGEHDIFGTMLKHLLSSHALRGRVAHGPLIAVTDKDIRDLHQATTAMEVLCFLLTARDLPMTKDVKKRLWRHRVIRDYMFTRH